MKLQFINNNIFNKETGKHKWHQVIFCWLPLEMKDMKMALLE